MINCGTLCLYCDYPITIDTYSGCTHDCKYCYVREDKAIQKVEPLNEKKDLIAFISGERTAKTKWCDWDIPIRLGAFSDPFQPAEKEHKRTLELLRIFSKTQYPFIVTTKNPTLAVTEPYLSVLKKCNCVFQVSMACSSYDRVEPGAPPYQERLKAARELSKHVKRLIIRAQPYFIDKHKEIMSEIPNYAECGAHGIIVEGYSSGKRQKGLIKDGAYCFSLEILVPHFKAIREECHKNGLKFYCGEDRIRFLSDELTCCGTDGLEDFLPNTFNIQHLAHSTASPTKAMQDNSTYSAMRDWKRTRDFREQIKKKSFEQLVYQLGNGYIERYIDEREKWSDD